MQCCQRFLDFKEDLKKRPMVSSLASCACLVRFGNGNLVRAWRVALSDSMILPKTRFLKACVRMGYAKKAKEIWKILDKDESGFATIDELDPKGAEEP